MTRVNSNLYIENGIIDTLEGLTLGEDWNYNYDNVKFVYCLLDKRRYDLR